MIITGASGGIGHACVDRFIEEGASVACWCLKETANEGDCGSNTNILRLFCDVTDPCSVNAVCPGNTKTAMLNDVATQVGGYDGLTVDQ